MVRRCPRTSSQALRSRDQAPFPASPHQTGHAVFPHPAFRDPSSHRSRRCQPPSQPDTVPSGVLVRFLLGVVSLLGIHQPLPPLGTWTKCGPFPGRVSAPSPSTVLWATPTPAPLSPTSRVIPAYRVRLSQSTPLAGSPQGSHCWGGDGPLLFPRRLSLRSTPHTPQGSSVLLTPSSSHLPWPSPTDTRLGSLLAPFRGILLRRGRLRFMLRTRGLHSPFESSTPRVDAQVSPNAGGLLQRWLGPSFGRTFTGKSS